MKNNEVNITLTAKDKASSKFKKIGKNAGGLGSRLKGLGGPLKAIGIGASAAGVALSAVGLKMFDMADSLETTIGKSHIVFGEYFDDIDKFGKENAKAMGLSRGEFLKTASSMQDLLIPMGFTRKEATGMTKDTVKLAGALSEWSAGQYTATEAGEILTKAMLGETEQLKSMGISISVGSDEFKNLQASIMETTGTTEQQSKAMAIQQLIMEKSTDAQKAYADGADSLTRKKAEMSATMKNLHETIAGSLLPAFHEIVKVLQPIIEKVTTSIGLWFENEENVAKLTGTLKSIITVFGIVGKAIGLIVEFLYRFGETLGKISAKIYLFVVDVIGFFGELKTKVSEKITALKTSLSEIWTGIKESISNIASNIYTAVVGKFEGLVKKVKEFFKTITGIYNKAKDLGDKASKKAASFGATIYKMTHSDSATSGARATGGPAIGGNSYLVGENGPEIFTPAQSGNVTANNQIGGSINITFNGNLGNDGDRRNMIEEIKMALSREMQYASYGIN